MNGIIMRPQLIIFEIGSSFSVCILIQLLEVILNFWFRNWAGVLTGLFVKLMILPVSELGGNIAKIVFLRECFVFISRHI